MTTRNEVQAELDKVEDRYLGVVYRLILSLERPSDSDEPADDWSAFLASAYGSTADAPIERDEQGEFEVRDSLR